MEHLLRFVTVPHPSRFRTPEAERAFNDMERTPFAPEKFVDTTSSGFKIIAGHLQHSGLLPFWADLNPTPYYPILVREFYANLDSTTTSGKITLSSVVKGHLFHLTGDMISFLLRLPVSHTFPLSMDFSDPSITALLAPNFHKNLPSSALNIPARLMVKVIMSNLIPRAGSYDYLSNKVTASLYALMGNQPICGGSVMIESLVKSGRTHFFLPCLITRILQAFHIPLDGSLVDDHVEFLNDDTIHRMRIILTESDDDAEPMVAEGDPISPSPTPVSPHPHSAQTSAGSAGPIPPGGRQGDPKSPGSGSAGPSSPGPRHGVKRTVHMETGPSSSQVPGPSVSLRSEIRSLREELRSGFAGLQTHLSSVDSTLQQHNVVLTSLQTTQTEILDYLAGRRATSPGSPSGRTRSRTTSRGSGRPQ